MKTALETTNIQLDNETSYDLINIFNMTDNKEVAPFMNIFWQEQQKLFSQSPKGYRFHPMMIRFCISLAAKS